MNDGEVSLWRAEGVEGDCDMEVKSELYEEKSFEKASTLENSNSLITLKVYPSAKKIDYDDDGDLIVTRNVPLLIHIEFSKSTVIPLVGLQIWRGAFLLADFILSHHRHLFEGKVVLELAAGVGLTSIVAGMTAKNVICTDIDKGGILPLIRRNFERNKSIMKATTSVLPLDFYQENYCVALKRELEETEVIIAADVIYDNDLSEVFANCLTQLMKIPPKKTFYLALEKRYVFTVEDLDVVAPCYDHFFKYLSALWTSPPMNSWKMEQLELDFEQIFNYERTKHLVLWKFTS